MRFKNVLSVAVAPILIVTSTSLARPVAADDAQFDGTWKMVEWRPFDQYEFAIIKVSQQDGKTTATVVDARTVVCSDKEVPWLSQLITTGVRRSPLLIRVGTKPR